jgi:hypothetical protein
MNMISRIYEYSKNKATTYLIIQEIIRGTHYLINIHKLFILHSY